MSEKEPLRWRWRILCGAVLALAVSFLFLGIAMYFIIIPVVVEQSIRQNSQLLEGSRLMEKWKNPAYKIQFKLYVYSVKNPDEIMSGDKPEVVVSGPYTFDEKMENRVISTSDGRVKFKRFQTYHFNVDDSCQTCILGNRVWVPNMIYQKFVEAASTTGMRAAATTLLSQTAFLEVEVGELLFEGYKDPFLDKICEIPFMNFVCDAILDLPDRIGLFYGKNNSADGVYEVMDGSKSAADLGKMVTWNGSPTLDANWWSSEDALKLRGTEGSLFPPFIQKNDKLWVYVTQLCRSIWLEFEKDIECEGVPAYRFVMPPEVFDTGLEQNKGFCNPTEKRFFSSQNDTNYCWPKGLLDISKCQRSQPPIMISLPNFLFADDAVKKSVKGLNESNTERDGIIVDIEPRTGVVLRAQRRSQVNVEMWKGKDLTFPINLKKMRSSLVPLVIVHEDVMIDDVSLDLIKSELINTEWWSYALSKLLTVCGAVLLLIGTLLTLFKLGHFNSLCHRNDQTVSPMPDYIPRSSLTKI